MFVRMELHVINLREATQRRVRKALATDRVRRRSTCPRLRVSQALCATATSHGRTLLLLQYKTNLLCLIAVESGT